jgi:hypothetical protein
MVHWGRIVVVLAGATALLAPGAQAASPYARAALVNCDREQRQAVFEGRVLSYRGAAKMQLRFTLQAFTPDEPLWRKVDAAGFGQWITAPSGLEKYIYDKTVQDLLAPASYRAVVNFRWRDARGRLVRSERAVSPVCRQPDSRPDLIVRNVRVEAREGRYVAVVHNRGREAAGAFDVDFMRDGVALGSATVEGLGPQAVVTVGVSGPPGRPCSPGEQVEAVADARSDVDEADEENDSLSVSC